MRDALAPWLAAEDFALDEIDVDTEPQLAARWGAYVPVLLAGERELCHYRLDRSALADYCRGAAR